MPLAAEDVDRFDASGLGIGGRLKQHADEVVCVGSIVWTDKKSCCAISAFDIPRASRRRTSLRNAHRNQPRLRNAVPPRKRRGRRFERAGHDVASDAVDSQRVV